MGHHLGSIKNDLAIATSLADFIENDGVKIATAHFPLTILQSN
jgi:hypothetical protein